MSASSPHVAVVIPCYGQAKFLPGAGGQRGRQTLTIWRSSSSTTASRTRPRKDGRLAGRGAPGPHDRLIRQANQGCREPQRRRRRVPPPIHRPLDTDDKLPGVCGAEGGSARRAPGGVHRRRRPSHVRRRPPAHPHSPCDFVDLARTNRIGVVAMFRRRAWEDVGATTSRCARATASRTRTGISGWGAPSAAISASTSGAPCSTTAFARQHVPQRRRPAHQGPHRLNHPVLYSAEQATGQRASLTATRGARDRRRGLRGADAWRAGGHAAAHG